MADQAGRHLRLCGHIDVSGLAAALPAYLPGFDEERWRQEHPGSPHRCTKTLYLRMPALDAGDLPGAVFNALDVLDRSCMEEPAFRRAVYAVGELVDAEPARAMIVMLEPGGIIAQHIDQGVYAEATDRYHLCISSNDQCFMSVGGGLARARPGECWFFNKHAPHSVTNSGADWRTHLIVDCWRGRSHAEASQGGR